MSTVMDAERAEPMAVPESRTNVSIMELRKMKSQSGAMPTDLAQG